MLRWCPTKFNISFLSTTHQRMWRLSWAWVCPLVTSFARDPPKCDNLQSHSTSDPAVERTRCSLESGCYGAWLRIIELTCQFSIPENIQTRHASSSSSKHAPTFKLFHSKLRSINPCDNSYAKMFWNYKTRKNLLNSNTNPKKNIKLGCLLLKTSSSSGKWL